MYYKKHGRKAPAKSSIIEGDAKEKYLDQEAMGEYRAVTITQVGVTQIPHPYYVNL